MPFENLLNISVKKDWVDYLSALLMPIGMMYIAYMQWLTEEARRRHELLDKRYKQLNAVTKFVFSAMHLSSKADEEYANYEAGDSLWSEIAEMRFIFNLEIEQYVSTHIIEPYEEIQQLRTGEERQNNAARQRELKSNLRKNLQKFQEKTQGYMQIEQPSLLKKLRQYLAALWEKIQKAAE